MKATIEIAADTEATFQQVKGKHFWSGGDTVRGPDRVTGYTLVLTLEFTEEEKAIVSKYGLHNVALDEDPLYTDAEIRERLETMKQNLSRDDQNSPSVRRLLTESKKDLRQQKFEYHFGLFAADYHLPFDSEYQAHVHADWLKTKILPLMKRLLDANRHRQRKETIEL